MTLHGENILLMLAAIVAGAASLSAFAESPGEPACNVAHVSEFVSGEFLLLVEHRSEDGYEVVV